MAYRSVHDGGCWYCLNDSGDMNFCDEFDCYIHIECLTERIKGTDLTVDRETKIIAEEFKGIPAVSEAMDKAQSPSRS